MEELGLEPLKKILQQFGGWPAVMGDKWNDTTFVWDEMIYKIRQAGITNDFLISLQVTADSKNSTSRVITVIF